MRHHIRHGRRNVGRIECQEVPHHEIHCSVEIVIPERHPNAPFGVAVQRLRTLEAERIRHIRERAIAVVEVEDVGAVVEEIYVDIAIAVVVQRSRCHTPVAIVDTSLRPNLRKRPVTIVAVELVRRIREDTAFRVANALQVGAVQHVQVQIAIPVVVQHGHAGATAFQDVLVGVVTEGVSEIDARLVGDVREDHGRFPHARGHGDNAQQQGS